MEIITDSKKSQITDNYKVSECRYCNSPLSKPFLSLGKQPLANNLITHSQIGEKEFVCDLALSLCENCGLTQLSHVVPPDMMFKHYLYVSSTTETFRKHFAEYAKDLRSKVIKNGTPIAVDVGSNDGLLVQCYLNEGFNAVGVDPAENLAETANALGIPTINSYFDDKCVDQIISEYGKADLISGNNVFAHIGDIQTLMANVCKLLSDNGIFVIEFPYYATMLEDCVFDMIYHEHISYINIKPLKYLMNKYGLEIIDVQKVNSHGGSLRVYTSWKNGIYKPTSASQEFIDQENKNNYNTIESSIKFANKVSSVKSKLWEFVNNAKNEGSTIAGYGAPAKASTLINYCGFTSNDIKFIVDDNALKQEKLIPGAQIPIVNSKYLINHPIDLVIIFAWNFAEEIMKKNDYLRNIGTKFIIPLPEPRVV